MRVELGGAMCLEVILGRASLDRGATGFRQVNRGGIVKYQLGW